MFNAERLAQLVATVPPEHVDAFAALFAEDRSTAERVAAVEGVLRAGGQAWRDEIGNWIADLLEVEKLVPEPSAAWRPLIRDCMAFFAAHFSDGRLAPKIVQQLELPPETPVEERLGLLIAKTPGLQKLGQILARSRRLSPALRTELQKLENGIADVSAAEIRDVLVRELHASIEAYGVELAPELLSEASVSAILEFTWVNPATGSREAGVFKVMKPHIPACYAEDLALLQQLAEHLASGRYQYGSSHEVGETLEDVRLLLANEVDFRREQATLAEVRRVYRRPGARAPRPIPVLSTDRVTAMSIERGVKVTEAFLRRPRWGRRAATRIVEALVADPVFSPEEDAIFHADPHAGNLLYDEARDELIILDWALTGRLNLEQRRQMASLIVTMTFRDSGGVRAAIHALSSGATASRQAADREVIDRCVDRFFKDLPLVCSLGALDAMRLLDRIGLEGVRFPSSLVLIRKVMFTLDGVLRDVAGEEVRLDTVIARDFVARWVKRFGRVPAPFSYRDVVSIERSILWYATGLWSWSV